MVYAVTALPPLYVASQNTSTLFPLTNVDGLAGAVGISAALIEIEVDSSEKSM